MIHRLPPHVCTHSVRIDYEFDINKLTGGPKQLWPVPPVIITSQPRSHLIEIDDQCLTIHDEALEDLIKVLQSKKEFSGFPVSEGGAK